MKLTNTDILISGASVAGPVLAYWLRRHGFTPTVVERTPALRAGLGGHGVDLFGPAMDVADWMGLLPQVLAARTSIERMSLERRGKPAVKVDLTGLYAGISRRHVEIMRGELASIVYEATRHDVEYLFGDSIRGLEEDGEGVKVTFDNAVPRRFALVVGADGLHSNVRRLTFGDESQFRRYIGGYFSVFTVPNYLGLDGLMLNYNAPGKVVAMYPVRQTGEARAAFLFRRGAEFNYDYRDVQQQKRLLQGVFAGEGWQAPRLLAEMEHAADFYLDSISQIRMDSWSRGRITLVGDAGYSPGPAVGGGTTVAVVGAYILAGELRAVGGDHVTAFGNYEARMREFVHRAFTIGPAVMKTLIPATPRQVWLTAQVLRFLPRLPAAVQRRLNAVLGGPTRTLQSITLKDYETTG